MCASVCGNSFSDATIVPLANALYDGNIIGDSRHIHIMKILARVSQTSMRAHIRLVRMLKSF